MKSLVALVVLFVLPIFSLSAKAEGTCPGPGVRFERANRCSCPENSSRRQLGCKPHPGGFGSMDCFDTCYSEEVSLPPVSGPVEIVNGTLEPAPGATTPPPPRPAPVAPTLLPASVWEECGDFTVDPQRRRQACLNILDKNNLTQADLAMGYALLCKAERDLGSRSEAMKDCDSAIRHNKELSLAYGLRGYLNWVADNYPRAIDDYTQALKLLKRPNQTTYEYEPPVDEYYGTRGRIYSELSRPNEAISDLSKAIQLTPQRYLKYIGSYYEALGKSYELLSQPEEALANYRKALSRKPAAPAEVQSAIKRLQSELEQSAPPSYSDSCIVLGTPTPSGVGCGGGRLWYWTSARISKAPGCPSSLEIEYIDPATGKPDSLVIPERLQTCGAGVTQARVKK